MKLGYARVSTDEQELDLQFEALKRAGVDDLYFEKASGKSADRLILRGLLARLDDPAGGPHTVIVCKLDRLARSTRDLLEIIDRIGKAGAGFISLSEPWADTTSPAGRMVMTVLAGVAEFERARILERTSEGREHAKRNGVKFGRKPALTPERARAALKMLKTDSIKSVARVFGVDRGTISRLKARQ